MRNLSREIVEFNIGKLEIVLPMEVIENSIATNHKLSKVKARLGLTKNCYVVTGLCCMDG
jgi:hypothetical protein